MILFRVVRTSMGKFQNELALVVYAINLFSFNLNIITR